MTRKLYIALIALIVGMLHMSSSSYASHIAAADIYLDYIGTGPNDLKYRVNVIVYRACENNGGIGLSDVYSYRSQSLNVTGSRSMRAPFLDTLDQICDSALDVDGNLIVNSCLDGNSIYPGFERAHYIDTVTLPGVANDWVFQYSICCRNYGIANLCNPGSQSLVVLAYLNNTIRYNNSTPRFTVDPVPYLCRDKDVNFFNGPFDPDGDSVVIFNNQPLGCSAAGTGCTGPCGTNTEIPYDAASPGAGLPNYSLANPIVSTSGYNVDAIAGSASFHPMVAGKFVISFIAQEYDRMSGQMMSAAMRDVQVVVLECNAEEPLLDEEPNELKNGVWSIQGGNKLKTCVGNLLTFNLNAKSAIPGHKIIMSIDQSKVPTAVVSFINQETDTPSMSFEWIPTTMDLGVHNVIVTAVDSTCDASSPIKKSAFLNFAIEVLPGLDGGPDIYANCPGQEVELEGEGGPTINYRWSYLNGGSIPSTEIDNPRAQRPKVRPMTTTEYWVQTDSLPTGCKMDDTVRVIIPTLNTITITPPSPAVVCRPDYLDLQVNISGIKPNINLQCAPAPKFDTPYVNLDTFNVGNEKAYSSVGTPFRSLTEGNSVKVQFILNRRDLIKSGFESATIGGLSFSFDKTMSSATYNGLSISMKCTPLDTLSIKNGFEGGTTLVYGPDNLTFNPGVNYIYFNQSAYNWDTTMNILVELCYRTDQVNVAPNMYYTQMTSPVMMMQTATGIASICDGPANVGPLEAVNNRPDVGLLNKRSEDRDFDLVWTPGRQLSDSTSATPRAYVDRTIKYTVSTKTRKGCDISASIDILQPVHSYKMLPEDTSVCYLEPTPVMLNYGQKVEWYENNFQAPKTLECNVCNPTVARPIEDITYVAVVTDSLGCKDTLASTFDVRPLPEVKILNADTTILYGSEIQLLASGGYMYLWSPAGSLSNPTVPDPIARPLDPTDYVVSVVGYNGCANKDTVHIDIDYRGKLLIPNAFSPNGDGKNDVFKVANLTFQRVVEFRVFNRYGQEVFNTIDAGTGWDGTFNGEPQGVGTYMYMIKIGYPDGHIENYTGDVTLIR
jgi:gliding motility-associated-like protein